MSQYATMATGSLQQLTRQNKDISAELREQIRLTREAARGISQNGVTGTGNPYVVPGAPASGGLGTPSAGGMREVAKLGKLGGEFATRGLGALSSGRNIKEILHEFVGESVGVAVAQYVPMAFAAYMAGNLIAEKVVDHIIGSTNEEVDKVIRRGQQIDHLNSIGFIEEARDELRERAKAEATKEVLKQFATKPPANPNEVVADPNRSNWGYGPNAHTEYTTKGSQYEVQLGQFIASKEEEIDKKTEERVKKLAGMFVQLQHDSSLQYSAGINREAIIAELVAGGKEFTERTITKAMADMMLKISQTEDAVHSAVAAKIENKRIKAEKKAAEEDADPSLPCIRKQQQQYMRQFEELQMHRQGDWSTY